MIKYHTAVRVTWKYYASNTQENEKKTTSQQTSSLEVCNSWPATLFCTWLYGWGFNGCMTAGIVLHNVKIFIVRREEDECPL